MKITWEDIYKAAVKEYAKEANKIIPIFDQTSGTGFEIYQKLYEMRKRVFSHYKFWSFPREYRGKLLRIIHLDRYFVYDEHIQGFVESWKINKELFKYI